LAGIPPTIGFFGKLYLFSAAVSQGLLWLALWGVLNSVISAYYYLRPIVMMYMQDSQQTENLAPLWGSHAIAASFALLTLLLGIFSGPLYQMVQAILG
jgi:NADH-quinone oxidoreductase subunit N